MAFCKYSTEFIANSKTEIDNIFLNDYLPFAQPQFVVVYIYGLYLCNSNSFDNSIENFAKTLNMSEEDVIGAFEYWEEQGLVQVLKTNPVQITYIPLKNVLHTKHFIWRNGRVCLCFYIAFTYNLSLH